MSDDKHTEEPQGILEQMASAGKTLLGFATDVANTDIKSAGERLLAKVAGEDVPEEEEPTPAKVAIVRPIRSVPLAPVACDSGTPGGQEEPRAESPGASSEAIIAPTKEGE